MVSVKRNVERKVEYGIETAQVIGPQEMLLSQLYGSREETEHRIKDRQLQQHRDAARHRADTRPLVQFHHRLLLLHRVFRLRIFLIQLVDLRLDDTHLGRRRIGLECQRRQDKLDAKGHEQDDDSEIGYILVKPVEERYDHPFVYLARKPASELDDVFKTVAARLQCLVMVRADVKIEKATPRNILVVTINKDGENPTITEIDRVSKPGRRVYAKVDEIPTVMSGRGIVVISTSKGIMTGREAVKQRLGGELICKVY